MKRILCLLCVISLALCLPACSPQNEKLITPVNFYYLRLEPTHGAKDSLITATQIEGFGYTGKQAELLQMYLSMQPEDTTLYSPFPQDLKLLALNLTENSAEIQLDKSFAQLTGLSLNLACACLTLTAMELTGVQSVRISAKNATLDGASYIVMDMDNLTILDLYDPNASQ